MTAPPPPELPPAPLARRARITRIVYGALTWGLVVFVAWRLMPHLGAVLGLGDRPERRPEFRYAALDGATLSAESLRGRVVLVNAWATWCLPCRAEMPLLEQMWTRHRDRGLTIVGLSADTLPAAMVASWVAARGLTFPVAIARAGDFNQLGGVQAFPTSFLIDRHGYVRHRVVGPIGAVSLELAVRRLLDER
jgi:thiol-disulfide isomerase/thioredoxin